MNPNRQLHLWPWVVAGCVISVVNPIAGAFWLFPVMVVWIARRLEIGEPELEKWVWACQVHGLIATNLLLDTHVPASSEQLCPYCREVLVARKMTDERDVPS